MVALFRPFQQIGLLNQNEGVPRWVSEVNVGTWYLFAGLAIVGAGRLRGEGEPLAALLGRRRARAEAAVAVVAPAPTEPSPDRRVTRRRTPE